MRLFALLTWTTLIIACGATGVAADVPPAEIESVLRCMDEQSLVLVQADLSQVQSDPLAMTLLGRLQESRPGGQQAPEEFAQHVKRVVGMGIRTMYLVLRVPQTLKQPNETLFVIPGSNQEELNRWQNQFGKESKIIGNALVFGPEELLAAASAQPKPPRPDLEAALKAGRDSALVAVVIPSDDQRRVPGELMPDLPAELGGGAVRKFVRAARWTTISYAPKKSLRIILQTDSDLAAHEVAVALDEFLDRIEQPMQAIPDLVAFAPVVSELSPKTVGSQVVCELSGKQFAVVEEVGKSIELFAEGAASRAQAVNQMKQIALAMHNFADVNKHFPDAASKDADGKPLLSWRVQLLPYLEQEELFRQFKLDEPWDSENNRKLVEKMPDVFRLQSRKDAASGTTCIVLPVGKATIAPEGRGMQFREIIDGTSNTFLFVEVDNEHAVPWTKPDDLAYDPEKPAAGLGGHFGEKFLAAMADGSVQTIHRDAEPDTLRALFTAQGKEAVQLPR